MKAVPRVSLVDQTCEFLRTGLKDGRWAGRLPASRRLASELGVAQNTLLAAQTRLVREGLLRKAGRRSLEITAGAPRPANAPLRVAFLVSTKYERAGVFIRELLSQACTELEAQGHICLQLVHADTIADSPGEDFAARVAEVDANAWIVVGGSAGTLSWFLEHDIPVLAMGGRSMDLPVAAVGGLAEVAIREALQTLITLGHRRIVFVCPRVWRAPTEGRLVKCFRAELQSAGVPVGPFNLPEWDESPEGYRQLLRDLFRLTPPTAIIFGAYEPLLATISFAATRGIVIPRDLSLIIMEMDASLEWVEPELAHFNRPVQKILSNLLQWVDDLHNGRGDPREKRMVEARFVSGHSLAEAPGSVRRSAPGSA